MVEWKKLRLRAGVSLEKAAARADVTSATARVFELDPTAVRDERKRAALTRTYADFALLEVTADSTARVGGAR